MQGYATVGDIYGAGASPTFDAANLIGPENAPATTGQAVSDAGGPALQPVQLFKGLRGINPLVGGLVVILVLLGLKVLREYKREDDFKEAKAGLYFGGMATLWVAALLPLLKALLAKYQIPGVSAYVQNA